MEGFLSDLEEQTGPDSEARIALDELRESLRDMEIARRSAGLEPREGILAEDADERATGSNRDGGSQGSFEMQLSSAMSMLRGMEAQMDEVEEMLEAMSRCVSRAAPESAVVQLASCDALSWTVPGQQRPAQTRGMWSAFFRERVVIRCVHRLELLL